MARAFVIDLEQSRYQLETCGSDDEDKIRQRGRGGAVMANGVLVRDRRSGGIAWFRNCDEPIKVRVCRTCGRAHTAAVPSSCPAA
jgi:hypothetical protein